MFFGGVATYREEPCLLMYLRKPLGNAYWYGKCVEKDDKKAVHYYQLAAMAGDATSRTHLGIIEISAGNMDREPCDTGSWQQLLETILH